MPIFANLEVVMARHNITQEALAKIAGVTPPTVTKWKQGTQPRVEALQGVARHFGLSLDDLTSERHGLAAQQGRRITPVPSATYAPVLGRVAAGAEREAIGQPDEEYWVDPDLLEEYPDCFYLLVSGDSMDRLVHDGSYALIAPLKEPEHELFDDDVAAVIINGDDATLKRVKYTPEGVFLKPDSTNGQHRMRFIAADDPGAPYFKVLGKLIATVTPKRNRW